MFNTLAIGGSTIFVDNRADTIFTMRYKVAHDSLITWHPQTDHLKLYVARKDYD